MSKQENIQKQISAIDGKIARLKHRRGELVAQLSRIGASETERVADPTARSFTSSSRSVEAASRSAATGSPCDQVAGLISHLRRTLGDATWDVRYIPSSMLVSLSEAERSALDECVAKHNLKVRFQRLGQR